tara:strand:- start:4728 stop:4976 length:249 start_codon:yes stop_codon:yes gene_type:complete
MTKSYDDSMNDKKTFWEDFFDDDEIIEIIDPAKMQATDRTEFIDGIMKDYMMFKDQKELPMMVTFASKYGKLLSRLIKKFGH